MVNDKTLVSGTGRCDRLRNSQCPEIFLDYTRLRFCNQTHLGHGISHVPFVPGIPSYRPENGFHGCGKDAISRWTYVSWIETDIAVIETDLSCDTSQVGIAPDSRYELLTSAWMQSTS
jgi:hypothetical protein